MQQPNRQTVETVRDGEAARAVEKHRERAPRKRYTLQLDLDAVAPQNAEANAPRAALDL